MEFKEYGIAANGISLHVTELGDGPAVLFCHGFPDNSYTWRRQMKAVASAGIERLLPICAATDLVQPRKIRACTRRCLRPVT
jgi:pimeloyl-ACP methyl ester carboxylesterase